MKRLLLVVALSLFSLSVVSAQDATPIAYGEAVAGEISNEIFEVSYTFTGSEGDIIIAEMLPVDVLGDLTSPQVLILDAGGAVIGDSSETISFGQATLVLQLPSSSDYTVIATRRDGRSGDSVGEYTLTVLLPEVLAEGDEITGSVSSEGSTQYFIIQPEADARLTYSKTGGDLFPQVVLEVLGDSGEAFNVSGQSLDYAVFGTLFGGSTYVVEISEALFDFNFEEVTADFALSVAAVE
jgi:hypothetical protein